MRSTRYTVVGGGGGGGSAGPTIVYPQTLTVDDKAGERIAVPDSLSLDDMLTILRLGNREDLTVDDAVSQLRLSGAYPQAPSVADGESGTRIGMYDTLDVPDALSGLRLGAFDTIDLADFASSNRLTNKEDVNVAKKPTINTKLKEDCPQYLDFTGTSLNYAYTLDAAALKVLGDIDLRTTAAAMWSAPGAAFPCFFSKWDANAGNNKSYVLEFDGTNTGKLVFGWTANGSTVLAAISTASVASVAADWAVVSVRATLDVDNGAGGRTIVFYYKLSSWATAEQDAKSDAGWTQLGAPVVQAGTTSIFDSATPLIWGTLQNGATAYITAQIGAIVIKNGIAGTLAYDASANDAPFVANGSFTERAGGLTVQLVSNGTRTQQLRAKPTLNIYGSPTLKVTQDAEGLNVDDVTSGLRLTNAENANVDDALSSIHCTNLKYARGGTPDTDPAGDGWIDQAAATTNHGNEDLLVKGKSTVGTDERRALMEFDFSKFASLVAKTGGTHRLRIRAVNSAVVGSDTMTVTFKVTGSRPFTESTLTWNTAPGQVSPEVSKTVAIPSGAEADYFITLTDADLNALLGSWFSVYFVLPSTAAPNTVTIRSRDNATDSNRPYWELDLKR